MIKQLCRAGKACFVRIKSLPHNIALNKWDTPLNILRKMYSTQKQQYDLGDLKD
jgi:hypothetical protein